MKYMVQWEVVEEEKMSAHAGFGQMTAEEDIDQLGPNVKLIGRWHDLPSGTGVLILESDSIEDVTSYLYKWAPVLNSTVTPVLDDEEVRRVIRANPTN